MYYWKKITSVGGILGIMLLGLGVFFYLSHFAWQEQNAYTGISVYAAEEDYQEHFSPINITLKENQKDKIQLDYLCKIGDSYMIIGKIEDLNTNAGYYLKGMTNLKEKIEFHLSYADENLAFFTSHEQLEDFSSTKLQLFEKKLEGKTVLSTEEIDGDIFEDAVYGEEKEIPVDNAFKIDLK